MKEYVHKPLRYILSFKAKRKDARRKIFARCRTEQECIEYFTKHYNDRYTYSIYTYDWQFVKDLTIDYFKKGENTDEAELR